MVFWPLIFTTKCLYWLVRGFRSTVRQIVTGLAGGGLFNDNSSSGSYYSPILSWITNFDNRMPRAL